MRCQRARDVFESEGVTWGENQNNVQVLSPNELIQNSNLN